MNRFSAVLLVFAFAFGFSLSARADTLIYTLTMTADGSLGSTSFTNTLVTYTLTADTANIQAYPSSNSYYLYTFATATATVAGIGTYDITSSLEFQSYSTSPAYAFVNLSTTGGSSLDFYVWDAALNGYTLATTLGPVNAAPNYAAGSVETTGGTLDVSASQTDDVLFQAALPAVTSTTPEPSSWMLLSTGIVGVGGMARRRFAARG